MNEIEIRSVIGRAEFDAAIRLVYRAFPELRTRRDGRMDLAAARRQERLCGTNRGLSVVALGRQRVVGTIFAVPYRMRVGRATVRVVGIRNVTVTPRYRRLGIGSRLMQAIHERACQAGIPIAFLFGIRNYYHRFGYCPGLSWLTARCKVADVSGDATGWRIRRFREADHAWAGRLYHAMTRRCTGSRADRGRPRLKPDFGHVLERLDGRRRGYVIWNVRSKKNELQVPEHGYRGDDFVGPMLAFLKKQAVRHRLDT